MLRRLAQQRMTLSDLEWPFHTLRTISVVAELLVWILHGVFDYASVRHILQML